MGEIDILFIEGLETLLGETCCWAKPPFLSLFFLWRKLPPMKLTDSSITASLLVLMGLFSCVNAQSTTNYFAVYWIVLACFAGVGIIVAVLVCCLCRCCPCFACCGTCRRDSHSSSSHDQYVASQPTVVTTSMQPTSQTGVQISYAPGHTGQPVPAQMYGGQPVQPVQAQPSYPGLQPP